MRLPAVLCLVLAACQAGEIDIGPGGDGASTDDDRVEPDGALDDSDDDATPDAAVDEPAIDAAVADEPVDAAVAPEPADAGEPVACDEPVATSDPGKHYEGLACMSCHGPGGGAPRFTLGGTLFDGPESQVGVAGATITIVDANGDVTRLITALNGNFYTRQALAYPLEVTASRCPDTRKMVQTVPAPGNCNSCHTGVGQPGRVHLP